MTTSGRTSKNTFVILLFLLVLFSFLGCRKNSDKETELPENKNVAEKEMKSQLDSILADSFSEESGDEDEDSDSDEVVLYQLQEDGSYSAINDTNQGELLNDLIYSKMSYEIVSTSDTSCQIKINAVNYRLLFCEVLGINPDTLELVDDQLSQNNDYIQLMIDRIQNNDFQYVETIVNVPIENGSIMITEELVDAFYGKMYSFSEELYNTLSEK